MSVLQHSNPGAEIPVGYTFISEVKEKCNQKAIQEESSSTLVHPALVSMLGVVKDGQDLNSEEASSTPCVKAKKTQSSEDCSSRNVKHKKTDTTKDKGKAVKKHFC